MSRLRLVALAATICMALTGQQAFAAATTTIPPATLALTTTTTATTTLPPATTTTPSTTTTTPSTTTGVTVTPTPVQTPQPPRHGPKSGGQNGGSGGGVKASGKKAGKEKGAGAGANANGAAVAPPVAPVSGTAVPGIPSSCGGGATAPAYLLPIYQQASDAYGLGPQGPGVLAAINGVESGFGANLGPSSAGAIGWMQFMPSSWATYGVDANGDGIADPNNPQDAIFAAARYLQAAGMPGDTAGAIFAYNHADWYVSEVLANAACYGGGLGGAGLSSGVQQLICTPAPHSDIPADYLQAFEDAAGRYDLGEQGVWALAAVAKLESNFGRDMSAEQLITAGALGLDRSEWNRFEVDGDGDGRILRADIYDSAATLAREIWSRGDLRSGLFLHNQAEWYVQEVLNQADQLSGQCTTGSTDWFVALPQAFTNPLPGWQRGRIDMGVDFSAPPGTPILAPFNAVVAKVGAPGWPGGGGGVLLQPADGHYVYIYESVQAAVRPGEIVHAGQVIAYASGSSESTGIEVGFADASGAPLAHDVYTEGMVTSWGQRMDQFLTQLGAP